MTRRGLGDWGRRVTNESAPTPEAPDTAATSEAPALSAEESARRSASFGAAASQYARFRPGPPAESVAWLLESAPTTVVDLGAGTGALTRLLVERVSDVIAIEPDDRMREVLARDVPEASARKGWGEALPLEDHSADAVLASSSWHWMDAELALGEAARVLRPAGVLGAVWSGPDPDGPFLAAAQALLAQRRDDNDEDDSPDMASAIIDPHRTITELVIPDGSPFAVPEHHVHTWDVALNAEELIGLLGTFSWIILMTPERRERVVAEARRLLAEGLGVVGDVTVDVAYRADSWRTRVAG